ncbi:MAG: magnesium/cobalt transporter CorA [Chitinophagales bacterium]|nr:magnesium/cobalt transporter CorA [Chitinophagales bacterium]
MVNVKKIKPQKYLRYLYPSGLFATQRTKEILSVNPTIAPKREEAATVSVLVFDYDSETVEEKKFSDISGCLPYKDSKRISWINIDGLRKSDVDRVCNYFDIHPLVAEDILSQNQRPKMDEVDNHLFCLLNMLYYNKNDQTVEQEQISIVLGKNYVISFQEDATRDVFNTIRERLRMNNSRIRQRGADYLCYTMLDLIVDNYFLVMEQLGDRVEALEEEVVHSSNKITLGHINQLRKELIILKRNISPVRELVNGFVRNDSELLDDNTTKYFKDVYDHIVQANDLTENYRDMMINMHDLYINNVNLKLNEVMKVMAIVTCLLAPATVIGGIFGMNFQNIPWLHSPYGFFIAVGMMLFIPVWMLWFFKKRGWF